MKKELIEKFNKLLDELNKQLNGEDEFNEFHKALAIRQNKDNIDKFGKIPFEQRIIILPQCLRNSKECQAEEQSYLYICKRCGKCKINEIIKKAEELGYGKVFIVKGGKAVSDILKKEKPGAVIGVACYFEGSLGMMECKKCKVTSEFVVLNKEGCADTDLDLNDLYEVMEFFDTL